MPFIEFSTIQPYGRVAVNPRQIFSFAPESQTPGDDTELSTDGERTILVTESIVQVASKLGTNFRRFKAASVAGHDVYVNRDIVLHVLPHPQVANVCFIHGMKRRIAVSGGLDDVVQALS